MKRLRLRLTTLTAGSLIAINALAQPHTPAGATPQTPEATPTVLYWQRQRDGWFWYREPPAPPAPLAPAPPQTPPAPARAPELTAFDALQQRLDELKRIAVMNPSDANLLAYMRLQKRVMERSETFADRWQQLVWTTPDLDYALSGRPTNATAIAVYDEQQRERQAQTLRALATTHGLLFVFRSDCPYCHRFAPILKRFEQDYGITVFAVSLDGRGIPEYPRPQADNGIAARLQVNTVPALFLTDPATREIKPVGFGLMALSELVERVAALAPKRPSPYTLTETP